MSAEVANLSLQGPSLGDEAARLNDALASPPRNLDLVTRERIWTSAGSILAQGPLTSGDRGKTGLALGYVQSGKTTSITALIARGSDEGYRIIIALLGTTKLLLDQNTDRIDEALGIGVRSDYRWVEIRNPKGKKAAVDLRDWLDRGRTLLLPVLKHAGRLTDITGVLEQAKVADVPTLIVDDEADQASLNTKVKADDESRTYAAIAALRAQVPNHLYVQYTATPYAPLLLEPDDHMSPDFVEMLAPGPGYTGGREFFVDHAARVVRPIPTLDEQAAKSLPTQLPKSLLLACGSFIAGTAMLLGVGIDKAPVSMLVHSTQRNDVQQRYHFLVERRLNQWRDAVEAAAVITDLPDEVISERARLVTAGATDLSDADFIAQVRLVLRESTLWLVNSASDVKKVDWRVAPVHILIGGNKLDRGFTVEGLTVTYMNRPTSPQIDTLEQRARAFGYRQDLLPYCQFFATPRTIENLKATVFTEYDLRAELEDWIAAGGTVAGWAREIGLLLPAGAKPTRDAVLAAVDRFNTGAEWHSLRRPDLSPGARAANEALVRAVGLFNAVPRSYGRLAHPTMDLPLSTVRTDILEGWRTSSYSPGWRHDDIIQYLRRLPDQDQLVPVVLLQQEGGGPRERAWDSELGFINLFQGTDPNPRPGQPSYPGDRSLFDTERHPELIALEVHRAHPKGMENVDEVLALGLRLGNKVIVRRGQP